MSSANTENDAQYQLLSEANEKYINLGEPTHRQIAAQKIKREKTAAEWSQTVQNILNFKYQVREVLKEKLTKPISNKDITRRFFYKTALLLAGIWMIVEHLIYPLSLKFWQYGLPVLGVAILATYIMSLIKKTELATAKQDFENYGKHHKVYEEMRRSESRIEPIYNNFLHPLLAFIKEEMHPNEKLNLYFDLGHWKLVYLKKEGKDPLANRHVTHTDFYEMKVLEANGKLADNTLLSLDATKLVRVRNIRKRSQSGKIKHKTKNKYKMVYEVKMSFPTANFSLQESASKPVEGFKIKVSSNAKRHSVKVQQVVINANKDILPQHKVFVELMSKVYAMIKFSAA